MCCMYTVYSGMQEWVIQIPSIPILVSVLFPSLHLKYFRIKFLLLVIIIVMYELFLSVAVDVFVEENSLLELNIAAIKHLSYDEYISVFGVKRKDPGWMMQC